MANFCRNCGRPLENGRCPVCDGPAEDHFTPPAAPASGGAAFFSGLAGELKALFSSGDPFRIAPAAGFTLLALVCLLRAFFSLSDGISYGLYLALSWLDLIGCIAVGLAAVGLVKKGTAAGGGLLAGCVSALLGLTGVLNVLGVLVQHYFPFSYLRPCLFLLMLGLGLAVRDNLLRLFCLGGAGALALIMLVETFTGLPFLPQLALCWCCLCAALAVVKKQLQV